MLSAVVRMETGMLSRLWRAVNRRDKLLRRVREMAMHSLKVLNNECGPNHPSLPPAMNRTWMGLEPALWHHCADVWRPKPGIGTGLWAFREDPQAWLPLSNQHRVPGCLCPTIVGCVWPRHLLWKPQACADS